MSTTSSGTQQFPQQPRSSGSIAAANCPGCSRGFDTLSMQIACRACGASHHFDCWAGGHGCSVAGCPESQAAQAAVPAYAAGYAHPTAPLRQAVTHAHPQQLVPWVGGAVATTQVRRNMGFSPLEVLSLIHI